MERAETLWALLTVRANLGTVEMVQSIVQVKIMISLIFLVAQ